MNTKLGWYLLSGFVGAVSLFLAGPRVKIDTQLRKVELPEDLDQYLAQSEAKIPDITPQTEKTIFWANPEKTKTEYSIVYLHGFSATRQETAPLTNDVAANLGANLYYARLAGHGESGEALAQATVNDWLNDTMEAVEIGKRLGNKVIVMGVSTGGTLASWLALQPEGQDVFAYVMISPNYAPKNPQSELLNLPWGQQLLPPILGAEYSWEPISAENAMYWTHRYPSKALFQMMALVKFVRESKLEGFTRPVLVIYSPLDDVVNAKETKKQVARFGSQTKVVVQITERINKENHVLAGDILAANNTAPTEKTILDFIAGLK